MANYTLEYANGQAFHSDSDTPVSYLLLEMTAWIMANIPDAAIMAIDINYDNDANNIGLYYEDV